MRGKNFSRNAVLLSLIAVSSTTFANLPDEIDYRSYLSKYSAARTQSDMARANATEIMERINLAISQLEQISGDISVTESDIAQAIDLIQQLNGENLDLENTISQASAENRGLEDRIANLSNQIDNNQRTQEDIRLSMRAPMRNRDGFVKNLQAVESEMARTQRNLRPALKEMDELRDGIAKNEKKLTGAINERDRLATRAPKIDRDLQTTKSNLDSQVQKSVSLELKVSSEQTKLNSATSKKSQLEGELATLKSQKAAAEQAIKPLMAKKKEAQNTLATLNTKKSSAQSALTKATSNKSSLEGQVAKAKKDLQSAKNSISTLEAKQTSLSNMEAKLEADKSDYAAKISVVEETLKKLQENRNRKDAQKIKNLRMQRKELRTKITQADQKIAIVQKQLKDATAAVTKAKNTIASGESKISELEAKVSSSQAAIDKAQAQVKKASREIKAQSEVIASIDSEIATAAPELKRLAGKISKKSSQVSAAATEVNSAKSQLASVKSKLSSVNSQIAKLNKEVEELKKEKRSNAKRIEAIALEVDGYKKKVAKAQRRFKDVRRLVGTLRGTMKALETEGASYERRIVEIDRELDAKNADLKEVMAIRLQLEDEMQERQDHLSSNDLIISESNEKLFQNNNLIAAKNNQINSDRERVRDLTDSQERLTAQKKRDEFDFSTADASASELEVITQSKYSEYQKRDSLYSRYLGESKSLGADQGDEAGASAGAMEGSIDVEEVAFKYGEITGNKIGELKGYLAGLIDGKESGLNEGYNAGVNSQDSYDKGYAKGYELGAMKALEVAKESQYPKGFKIQKDELLSDAPTNSVTLSNSASGSLFLESGFAGTSNFVSDAEFDFSAPEVSTPYSFEASLEASMSSRIDAEIERTRASIYEYENNERTAKSAPQFAYTAPTRIDVDSEFKNCSNVYKQVSDFISACEKSYDDTFKSEFLGAHKDTFFAAYSAFFDDASDAAQEVSLGKDVQAGFDKAYKVAFAEAKEEGEGVAYQNGNASGQEDGYDEKIEEANESMLALGKNDASKHFAGNGVVRLNQAAQTSLKMASPKGMIQDSKFTVGLGVINFGAQESMRGAVSAQVISKTSNIVVESKFVNLRDLPNKTKINLTDVFRARVANNARPGSPIEMKIKLTYPGDKLASSYSEIANFVSNVKVNPEINSGVHFENKVKARKCVLGLFNCKFRKHDVEVKLTGLRDFIPGSYKVELKLLDGAKYAKVTNASAMVASPGQGVVASAKLRYEFINKKAKDKTLKFKAIVSYKGEVQSTKEFSVKVK